MNTGPIALRYAKALLKLVKETGAGEKVYSQVSVLVLRMQEIRQLADVIQKHPELCADRRLEILEAALGEPPAGELVRFVRLLCTNRRIDLFQRILISFLDQYRASNGIKVGYLITASPATQLKASLEGLMHDRTGARVILEERVDETLIGGFVLQLEDLRMDASVHTQLKRIYDQLVDKANRIV